MVGNSRKHGRLDHRRMKRGESVLVAIWTTRTLTVTTNPNRPTTAPTMTLSTLVAVEAEYRQASGPARSGRARA
jgi:hypothetical protein